MTIEEARKIVLLVQRYDEAVAALACLEGSRSLVFSNTVGEGPFPLPLLTILDVKTFYRKVTELTTNELHKITISHEGR